LCVRVRRVAANNLAARAEHLGRLEKRFLIKAQAEPALAVFEPQLAAVRMPVVTFS
jgi:hypothetical protein